MDKHIKTSMAMIIIKLRIVVMSVAQWKKRKENGIKEKQMSRAEPISTVHLQGALFI